MVVHGLFYPILKYFSVIRTHNRANDTYHWATLFQLFFNSILQTFIFNSTNDCFKATVTYLGPQEGSIKW